jgi:hypothetical protein
MSTWRRRAAAGGGGVASITCSLVNKLRATPMWPPLNSYGYLQKSQNKVIFFSLPLFESLSFNYLQPRIQRNMVEKREMGKK